MIEKALASINNENMELLQRQKEIMKLQSELIKKKKLLGSKVDSNILIICVNTYNNKNKEICNAFTLY